MKHHIIVKFDDTVADKAALIEEIRALYAPAAEISGVDGVSLIPNCIARPNRYDLMIVLSMAEDALPTWDASSLHATWKAEYGKYLEKKCIFDCE